MIENQPAVERTHAHPSRRDAYFARSYPTFPQILEHGQSVRGCDKIRPVQSFNS